MCADPIRDELDRGAAGDGAGCFGSLLLERYPTRQAVGEVFAEARRGLRVVGHGAMAGVVKLVPGC